MPPPLVWLNGALLPATEAKISVFDHGFLYGQGLFETMRGYAGKVFRLEAHVKRLTLAAARTGIPLPATIDLARAVEATVVANALGDARVRLTVTAGPGTGRPTLHPGGAPTILVVATPLADTRPASLRAILAAGRRSMQSTTVGLKSTSYLGNLLAYQEAKDQGADEALILNEFGEVTEGAISNVFAIHNGQLITPALSTGLLAGVTRSVVIELIRASGRRIEQGDLSLENMESAQEAFLTNSILELAPLVSVAGRTIGSGQPGLLTLELQLAYRALVKRELGLP